MSRLFCRRGVLQLVFLASGLLGPAHLVRAQAPDSLAAIGPRLQRYGQQVLVEKLYGHLDRPAYTVGETMWLKLYAVEGHSHRPLPLSKVAYVEVLNQAQQPVLRTSIALRQATGHGSLDLPASLPSGRYLVRAYTSWMQNFDPEFYFQAPITIVNTYRALELGPASTASPDIQFFPEGGSLVQGLASKVAFRVADGGRGVAATGTVRNQQGAVVATFSTLKFGLGSFLFTPAVAGAAYVAEVKLPDGTVATTPLPTVAARGYVLRLQDAGPTQLRISAATKEMGADGAVLTLVGHSGAQVVANQTLYADAQHETVFLVNKQSLRAGISHFTLFNSQRQPVGERLYFRRPPSLALAATAAKAQYGPREKVTLRLASPQATAAASLSVAVYQLDSLAAGAVPADINSVLSLTSDLKGTVENPGYYLRDSTQTGQEATDNLMLTHGWSRFRWEEVLSSQLPAFAHVPEFNGPLVRGQVLTAGGAPAAGIRAYLAWPDRVAQFYTAASDAQGGLQFELKDFYGPHKLVLQTDWRRDSTYRLALASPYSTRYAASALKPLALAPALQDALTQRHIQTQVQQAYFGQHRQYGLPARDTVPVYGMPAERYWLDTYTRFKTMEDVMREYVQGVLVRQSREGLRFLLMDTPHRLLFREAPLTLLDGVPVFEGRQLTNFDPLRIRRIDIVTNQYYYGSQVYSGVVSYATYKHDLGGYQLNPKALLETYEGLQGQRDFFAPHYDSPQQQQSPLADLRNLLYWNPELKTNPGQEQQVEFYTSDQAGRYLVVVQGLATNGLAGSTTTQLEVKPAL